MQYFFTANDKCREKLFYSRIFRPITTARLQMVACTDGAVTSLSIFLQNEWERGQVRACSKFVDGNKDNVKVTSILVGKIFGFCK